MPAEGEVPLKLACATCIQGHRASTCKHQDGSKGPLLVVRRRGRPLSQCAECREKRLRTGRHSRCDCNARAKAKTASQTPDSVPTELPAKRCNTRLSSTEGPSRTKRESPLSFDFILNPCKCKEGAACTCCRSHLDHLFDRKPATELQNRPAYTPSPKATDSFDRMSRCKNETPGKQTSCCKSGTGIDRVASERSMDLLVRAADMSKSFSLECQCGSKCRCNGCMAVHTHAEGAKEKSGPTCGSCIACDIQLQNPTGIEPVDRWAQVTDVMPHPSQMTVFK